MMTEDYTVCDECGKEGSTQNITQREDDLYLCEECWQEEILYRLKNDPRAGDIILVPHSEVYPDAPAGCDWQWVGEQGLQTILKAVPQYTEEMNRD